LGWPASESEQPAHHLNVTTYNKMMNNDGELKLHECRPFVILEKDVLLAIYLMANRTSLSHYLMANRTSLSHFFLVLPRLVFLY
jgi:hypothetical protein